jgi:hypothetical protein
MPAHHGSFPCNPSPCTRHHLANLTYSTRPVGNLPFKVWNTPETHRSQDQSGGRLCSRTRHSRLAICTHTFGQFLSYTDDQRTADACCKWSFSYSYSSAAQQSGSKTRRRKTIHGSGSGSPMGSGTGAASLAIRQVAAIRHPGIRVALHIRTIIAFTLNGSLIFKISYCSLYQKSPDAS